jgi:hypothetical protein
VTFDPATQTSSIVLALPSSVLVADALPSPDARWVVMAVGGCATSYFDEHLVVRDMRSGRQWTIGADAAPCHALFGAAWSSDGSELVFPYGPSILSRQTHFVPSDSCSAPRFSRLVVVAARRSSNSTSWKPIMADRGCSYQAATFDR